MPGTETEEEIRRLRRELDDVRMERDILKKAVAIFSKEPK
jgi:transposase